MISKCLSPFCLLLRDQITNYLTLPIAGRNTPKATRRNSDDLVTASRGGRSDLRPRPGPLCHCGAEALHRSLGELSREAPPRASRRGTVFLKPCAPVSSLEMAHERFCLDGRQVCSASKLKRTREAKGVFFLVKARLPEQDRTRPDRALWRLERGGWTNPPIRFHDLHS